MLIEQLATACRVLRQELLNFLADIRIGARKNRLAALTGGVVQFLDLPPLLRSQALPLRWMNGIMARTACDYTGSRFGSRPVAQI